jgi:hypothetical protein
MTRLLPALFFAALLAASPAQAAVDVSRFSVTPSTTRAGGHPSLALSVAFDPATSDVRDIQLHLPAGLRANPRAAPFCSRGRLISDLCPLRSKVGSIVLVGVAFGFEAVARRNIYNVRPAAGERLRLGIPVFGTASGGGVALQLPVRQRTDGGLDMAVAGPPQQVSGYEIGIKEVTFRIRGTVRTRSRGRTRKRHFLTNPRTCGAAVTTLEIATRSGQPPAVSRSSAFTPTGC